MTVPGVLRPLVRGSTWRRGVFLLLGGVLALPYALLAAAFVQLLGNGDVPPSDGVPPLLAVVPGTLVAIAVTAGTLGELAAPEFWRLANGFSSATASMLLRPSWGPALGAATLAYHLRRRGACAHCRRP